MRCVAPGARERGHSMAKARAVTGGGLFRHSIVVLFVAGFMSVLVFQSGATAILHALGYVASPPFGYAATKPLGVPAVWSAAFWGGLWGLVFGLAEKRFPQGVLYYVCAFLFGAIVPVLVLWFVVMPIKGGVIASGWNVQRMAIQMLVHGCYGLGVGILVRAFSRR
jgi:hypothetical protein